MKQFMKRHYKQDLKMYIKLMKYLCILLFFVSCNAQKKSASSNDIKNKSGEHELVLLLSDMYSGQNLPEIQIIKEPATLQKFFTKINRTRKPGLAVPKIDFRKEIVIIYCAGEQLNVMSPFIEIKEETEHQIILNVLNKNISSLNSTQEIATSPFCVYKLSSDHKAILFTKID